MTVNKLERQNMGKNIIKEQLDVNHKYVLSSIDMLFDASEYNSEGTESIKRVSIKLTEILNAFDIEAHVSGYTSGPRVTRYEMSLAPGICRQELSVDFLLCLVRPYRRPRQ